MHLFLTVDQHARLKKIAKEQGRTMTDVAREAITARLSFYEDERHLAAQQASVAREARQPRRPTGLGLGAAGNANPQPVESKPLERAESVPPVAAETLLEVAANNIRSICGDNTAEADRLIGELKTKMTKPSRSLVPKGIDFGVSSQRK